MALTELAPAMNLRNVEINEQTQRDRFRPRIIVLEIQYVVFAIVL